jgi:ABC-2 type transport system permease protein
VGIWNEGGYTYYYNDFLTEAEQHAARAYSMASHVYGTLTAFTIINLFLGVGLAMVLFGYLMKSNSVGLMHALPVSRTRQFLSHFGAGMSMLTAANLLTFLMSLLMECLIGIVDIMPLLIWLLTVELVGFFFLSFGTLCAMATGWLLAVPVIYFGLNFVVVAYHLLFDAVTSLLWPGHNGVTDPGGAVEWLTPVVKLANVLGNRYDLKVESYRKGATLFTVNHEALPTVLIYALAGVALLAFAWVLYRARHSESAGDAIVFPWLRPVVKYVISIAAGIALGLFVHEIILGGRNVIGLIICQMIMGGIVFCGVEMLLRKSYKIFDRRTLLGLTALWLALIAVCVCIRLDITGRERRVPTVAQVESVSIGGGGIVGVDTDDVKTVGAVTDLHQLLIKQGEPVDGNTAYDINTTYISMTYHLHSGEVISRGYRVDLDDPDQYQAYTEVLNCETVRQRLLIDEYDRYGNQFNYGYVTNYVDDENLELTPGQCRALYRALEQDMEHRVTPEMLGDDVSGVEIVLDTDRGEYRIYRLRPDCTNTLELLERYGVTIPEGSFKEYR